MSIALHAVGQAPLAAQATVAAIPKKPPRRQIVAARDARLVPEQR